MTVHGSSPQISAETIFANWVACFADSLTSGDTERLIGLFDSACYWKDILSLTWEHRTFSGANEIRAALNDNWGAVRPCAVRSSSNRIPPRRLRRSGRTVIEGFFDFETNSGHGTGFARLIDNAADPLNPRIWFLLTTLQDLHGFEEKIGPRRPSGDKYSRNIIGNNWVDDRNAERASAEQAPDVLIVGAGHAGLILAARLRQMRVNALVIDKTARVGDVWRERYHSLTLHNGVTANHMPYLAFPETWPHWLPKDMLADWLEAYADFLELNVAASTELVHADYDDEDRVWTARLRAGDSAERVIRCKHLVAATGVSGSVPNIPDLLGLRDFHGDVMHSTAFRSGADYAGKRVIVIGGGSSGHDVAQDLVAHGADKIWLMQRGPTCVVSLKPSAELVYSIYNEGWPVADVDLIAAAVPYPLMEEAYRRITVKSAELDKPLLDKLHSVGFETFLGDDGTGFQMMYLRGQGGYYINVGGSELIANGEIGVMQMRNVDRFVPEGVRFRDGSVVPCDAVVLATGFANMQEGIRRMVGSKIADRVGTIWGFDENFTTRNMWRRTAQEGFWVTGGALTDSRFYSRFLAIEIKASLEGLLPQRSFAEMAETVVSA